MGKKMKRNCRCRHGRGSDLKGDAQDETFVNANEDSNLIAGADADAGDEACGEANGNMLDMGERSRDASLRRN